MTSRLSDMTREELIEQVRLCHEHYRRCIDVLRGKDAEPVTLVGDPGELGDSDDLELFYMCKFIGDADNITADDKQ